MNTIPNTQRYLPHDLNTKFHACKLYTHKNHSVAFVCRRYKISKASLMRWMKRFDGTRASLIDKSHRPHTKHPNAHTDEEIKWINNYIRRNPNIPMIELYTKLRINRGYTRHPSSLFRFLRKQGFYPSKKIKQPKYKPKLYHTPKNIGIKWQVDVKHVPKECKASTLEPFQKFYQYTVIDEASRERFIYHYDEYNSYTTVDFLKRAILYFGYKPKIIQTDNGAEFAHIRKTERIHALQHFCEQNNIQHNRIRPRTPRHNGKVERSHRNDNERFYKYLKFYSLMDLREQAKRYLYRSNNIAMATLGYLTPLEKRKQIENLFSS